MRFMRSSGRVRLGGLGPSIGAAASLLAAGVTLSLLVASLFGVRVWTSPSDRGEAGSVRLPAVEAAPAVAVAIRAPVQRPRAAAPVREVRRSAPARAARRPRAARPVPAPRA